LRPKLAVVFLLIVLGPLAVLGWLGYRVARDEQELVRQRFHGLLMGRLADIDAAVAGAIEGYERDLLRATEVRTLDTQTLRDLVRRHQLVRQVFVLDPDGRLTHPPRDDSISEEERGFLVRTKKIWSDKRFFAPDLEPQSAPRRGKVRRDYQTMASIPDHGWRVWYWEHGLDLLFWRRLPDNHVIGVEVDRVRLLADIVGELPQTDPLGSSLADGRIALLDAKGSTVYQWGVFDPGEDAPAAELPLRAPLTSWRLACYVPGEAMDRAVSGGFMFNFFSALFLVAATLVALSIYFYRESTREMRDSERRVSFVNQVSHELKTPLTNIRMYAELLENDLDDDDENARRHLGVVVAECQRLSRLISNVLTFGRRQRRRLKLRPTPGIIDDTVSAVLESFRPSLDSAGIKVEYRPGAGIPVRFDADALEQMLGNLFNNVEKYAASGGFMRVETAQQADRTTVTVADRGPGIPSFQREDIFRPFHRLSNKPSDGVTGTGIGLTISRDLARLHGGDLEILSAERGACFRLTLHTPPADPGGET